MSHCCSLQEHFPCVMCSRFFTAISCVRLNVSCFMWRFWATWTWALYKEIRKDQFAFYYLQTASWTSTICWKCCLFFHWMVLAPLTNKSDHMCVGSFLGLCLPLVYMPLSVPISCVFLSLLLCSIVWDQEWCFLSHSFIVENDFHYTGIYKYEINFIIAFSISVKKWVGIVIGIALNL